MGSEMCIRDSIYVIEGISDGANSSPIVTKLSHFLCCQSYTLGHRGLWKVKVKGQGWWEVCALLNALLVSNSSYAHGEHGDNIIPGRNKRVRRCLL